MGTEGQLRKRGAVSFREKLRWVAESRPIVIALREKILQQISGAAVSSFADPLPLLRLRRGAVARLDLADDALLLSAQSRERLGLSHGR